MPRPIKDLSDKKHGSLTVLGLCYDGGSARGMTRWWCRCDCGHVYAPLAFNIQKNRGHCEKCCRRGRRFCVTCKAPYTGGHNSKYCPEHAPKRVLRIEDKDPERGSPKRRKRILVLCRRGLRTDLIARRLDVSESLVRLVRRSHGVPPPPRARRRRRDPPIPV